MAEAKAMAMAARLAAMADRLAAMADQPAAMADRPVQLSLGVATLETRAAQAGTNARGEAGTCSSGVGGNRGDEAVDDV
jgi:hypothetical protein